MSSPTSRSLKSLRDSGYTAQVVEHWNQFAHRRIDLFNVIDIIACKEGSGIIGIQSTTADHVSHRLEKIKAEGKAKTWLKAGGRLIIHGWGKKGARGKVKKWECRIIEIHAQDLP